MKAPNINTVVMGLYAVAILAGAYIVYRIVKQAGSGLQTLAQVPSAIGSAIHLATTAPVAAAAGNAVRLPGGRVVEMSSLQREGAYVKFEGETAVLYYGGSKLSLSPRGPDGIYNAGPYNPNAARDTAVLDSLGIPT